MSKKCVVCGSTRHKTYGVIERDKYIGQKIRYVKCRKCGLVFEKPQPLEKLKNLYQKEYRPKIGFLQTLFFMLPYSRHFKTNLNYIRQIPKGDVLDVGSSEGKFLYLLKLRGWGVLGIEPTFHYAEFANRVLKVPTINGSFEGVELFKKFDLVTFNGVFEHLSDPIKILEKVKKLVKKNGKLYISVPDLTTCPFPSAFHSPHLFMYDKETITTLLAKTGFTVESIDVINNKIHLIASTVPPRVNDKRGKLPS